jgi:hypothetical protein
VLFFISSPNWLCSQFPLFSPYILLAIPRPPPPIFFQKIGFVIVSFENVDASATARFKNPGKPAWQNQTGSDP